MIKFAVRVATLDQLEILLSVAKTLDLTPDLGVGEVVPSPSKRRQGRSTKRKAKLKARRKGSKPKRWARNMVVKTAPVNTKAVPPKALEAHQVLVKEFRGQAFNKSLAKGVIAKRMKTLGASGLVTRLMDSGGLVAA